MYKCNCCESLIPFTYSNCPVCGNTLSFKSLHKVKSKKVEDISEELNIDDSNLVVTSDMSLEDFNINS